MMMTDSIWSLQEIIIYDASREKGFHGQHFHLKQVLNQNLGIEKLSAPPERPLCRQRKKNKTHGRHLEGKREAHGLTVVSPTIRFANVLFANFWSRFTYLLGQFPNSFRLRSVFERTKYI